MYSKTLDQDYQNNTIFKDLQTLSEFYGSMSYGTMKWAGRGTTSLINLDTYVFSSIQGTLQSITLILKDGRINDAFSLLRKYFDSTIINIYTNLYIDDNFNIETFIVSKIQNWLEGTEQLPEYRIMSQYLKLSEKLKPITEIIDKDNIYKSIRERCNAHTHYNYYHNLITNDNNIATLNRIKHLDTYNSDLLHIFIQHLSYLFYISDHYMMADDYTDYKDLGMIPPQNSEYFVAPYIQDIFTNILNKHRPDLVQLIKSKTKMTLK